MRTLTTAVLLPLILALAVLNTGCAAKRHINAGQAAMMANDPITARYHFTRALEHESGLARKDGFVEAYRIARRDAAVVEGQRAIERDEPRKAIERFEVSLKYHRGWQPALDGLAQAHADAADDEHQHARQAADHGELSAAREHLETALNHQPDHPGATTALASLTLAPQQQPIEYRDAQSRTVEKQWDAALASLRRSIAAHPDFLPARAELPATLDAAARDMLDQGTALLAEQRFDDAEAVLLRTLDYRPEHADLEPALGQVDLARGDAALRNELPGSALLWYRRSAAHAKHEEADRGIASATRRIRDQHRVSLELIPESSSRTDMAEDLSARVQHRLSQRDAAALSFEPHGQPIQIALHSLHIPTVTITDDSRRHSYDVEYEVPNPDLPHLEHDLHRIEIDIQNLSRRESRLERRHHHLHLQHSFGPSCGCHHEVHHAHWQLASVQRDLRSAHADHRRASHRLYAAPHFVTRVRTEYWPYTRSTHVRTATLAADFALPDGSAQPIEVRITDSDTTISPARPDLGLREDPLDLRSDTALQDDLLDLAAQRMAKQLTHRLIRDRVETLDTRATKLRDTDPVAAQEAHVAAAVLLGAIDSSESKQRLDASP